MQYGRIWTPGDDAAAFALLVLGASHQTTANLLGRTRQSLRRRLGYLRTTNRYAAALPLLPKRKLGRKPRHIAAGDRGFQPVHSDAKIQAVEAAILSTRSYAAAARKVGLNKNQVCGIVFRYLPHLKGARRASSHSSRQRDVQRVRLESVRGV